MIFISDTAKAIVGTRIMVRNPLKISEIILDILGSRVFFIYPTIVA